MSTQCRFCGEAVRPDTMFCPSCGQLIGMGGSAVPPFGGGTTAHQQSPAATPDRPAEQLVPVPLPAPLPSEPPAPQPARESAPEPVTGAPEPVAGPPEPATAPPIRPTSLLLPDGRSVALDHVLVFGRSPEHGAPAHQGVPVRLDDPERAMSRVHLVVGPADGAVTALDPGSANGTLLERGGQTFTLVAGVPTALLPADRLLLGDAALVVS